MAGCNHAQRSYRYCPRFGKTTPVDKIEVSRWGTWWDVRCSCHHQETLDTKEQAILAADFHQMTDHPRDLVAITIT